MTILSSGQRVALGRSTQALTVEQPFSNTMLAPSVAATDEIGPETPSSGLANELHLRTGSDYTVLVSALSGGAISALDRGSDTYEVGLGKVRMVQNLSSGGKSDVAFVTLIHGESDAVAGSTTYRDDLRQLQQDYESDIRSITCQTGPVPMLLSQVSSWTHYGLNASRIPFDQLDASRDSDGRIVMVGPTYAYEYSDGTHLTSTASRALGTQFAKAAATPGWEALHPIEVARTDKVISIKFHVPVGELVLDTLNVTDPGNYGFVFDDGSQHPPEIDNISIVAPDTLLVTLGTSPQGSSDLLRYAATGKAGAAAGPRTGPRGNLRDSDPAISMYGTPLWDWCVAFEMPVP
jgi:hypothetical protein